MDFADRVTRVEPSATLAISSLASELEQAGADIVDLSVGEPDFDTPEHIIDAATAALEAGHTGYTAPAGIAPLRQSIASYLQSCGLPYESDDVIVTPGAKQALYEVVQTLIQDGDEVVLLDPAWVSYEQMVNLADGTVSRIDLAPHGFQLEPALDALESTVSDDSELLILNSPSNPTGAVYSDAALEGVRDLAIDHDFTVISDEIYREITYGIEPTSIGSLDGMAERTVTVNGFSKAYAMTGWRLGYYAAPGELIDQSGKLHSHSVTCAVNFVQHAGVEALENSDDSVQSMVRAFESRRDLVIDLLADAGVEAATPDGAFYLMLPVDADDQSWCEGALEDAHVGLVPGHAFGAPGYARMSYAASEERLREGINRLTAEGYL